MKGRKGEKVKRGKGKRKPMKLISGRHQTGGAGVWPEQARASACGYRKIAL
jgi:hypothetical protein